MSHNLDYPKIYPVFKSSKNSWVILCQEVISNLICKLVYLTNAL